MAGYALPVVLQVSDPTARVANVTGPSQPGDGRGRRAFTAADRGQVQFDVTFSKAGSHTVAVRDADQSEGTAPATTLAVNVVPAATMTAAPTPTPTSTATPTATPTSTPTSTATATAAPTAPATASATAAPPPTATSTPAPTSIPTATPPAPSPTVSPSATPVGAGRGVSAAAAAGARRDDQCARRDEPAHGRPRDRPPGRAIPAGESELLRRCEHHQHL
ncbi:MAG: hypothetical protein HYX51_04030 [Chloroflexi bacterium]|nr:hypothetical protein [Chloroflexota bacterium]